MTIATPEDVETSLLRELTEQESLYVERMLGRAENLLLVRIPDLLHRAETDAPFKELVATTEAEAVARVYRADNAGIYETENEDGYGYKLNFKVASGLLDILAEEWARLFGTGGFRSIAPETDGYAARRRHYRPDLQFQFGWPAHDQVSEGWG